MERVSYVRFGNPVTHMSDDSKWEIKPLGAGYSVQDLPGFAPACDRRHFCARYYYYDSVGKNVNDQISNSL